MSFGAEGQQNSRQCSHYHQMGGERGLVYSPALLGSLLCGEGLQAEHRRGLLKHRLIPRSLDQPTLCDAPPLELLPRSPAEAGHASLHLGAVGVLLHALQDGAMHLRQLALVSLEPNVCRGCARIDKTRVRKKMCLHRHFLVSLLSCRPSLFSPREIHTET
jgi:hypothetical protein